MVFGHEPEYRVDDQWRDVGELHHSRVERDDLLLGARDQRHWYRAFEYGDADGEHWKPHDGFFHDQR